MTWGRRPRLASGEQETKTMKAKAWSSSSSSPYLSSRLSTRDTILAAGRSAQGRAEVGSGEGWGRQLRDEGWEWKLGDQLRARLRSEAKGWRLSVEAGGSVENKAEVGGWGLRLMDEGWGRRLRDEGWGRRLRDEGWGRRLRDEGWGRRLRDEGWGRRQRDEGWGQRLRDEGWEWRLGRRLILGTGGGRLGSPAQGEGWGRQLRDEGW